MRRHCWCAVSVVAAVAAIIVSHIGCAGASPSAPSKQSQSFPISQSAMETVVSKFARGATGAANSGMTTMAYALRPSAFPRGFGTERRFRILPVQMTSYPVNIPIDYTVNCSSGGYHKIVGRVSGTINPQGVSRLQMNANQTIVGYRCLGGWTIDGDPYIGNSGYITETAGQVSMEFDQTLGWRARNDSTGTIVSCQHSIRVTYDDRSGGRLFGEVRCSPPTWTFSLSASF